VSDAVRTIAVVGCLGTFATSIWLADSPGCHVATIAFGFLFFAVVAFTD